MTNEVMAHVNLCLGFAGIMLAWALSMVRMTAWPMYIVFAIFSLNMYIGQSSYSAHWASTLVHIITCGIIFGVILIVAHALFRVDKLALKRYRYSNNRLENGVIKCICSTHEQRSIKNKLLIKEFIKINIFSSPIVIIYCLVMFNYASPIVVIMSTLLITILGSFISALWIKLEYLDSDCIEVIRC